MTGRAALRRQWAWWLAMAVVVSGVFVFAGSRPPDEGTSDDRLYSLAEQLKCLQCVGESVAASQSPLAQQFRDEISQQMSAGETDDEILAFFADRYGEEVLLDPPTSGIGALAWLLPVIVAGGAVVGLGFAFSRWRSGDVAATGPRVDEVVPVGAAKQSPKADRPTETDPDREEPDRQESVSGARWKGAAIAGGVGAFAVLVGVLVVSGSGDRGDGELTGGIPNASGSTDSSGLGECQPLAMSDAESGIECYDEILEADPTNAEALTYRGWAKLRAGQPEPALADLSAATELAPEFADPHVFLAIAARDAGDYETAAEEMSAFWAADPTGVAVSVVQSEGLEREIFFGLMAAPTRDCWQSAAQEAPEGDIDQAFLDALGSCLAPVVAADPTDGEARLSLAMANLGPDESDVVAARSLLEGLLAEDPSNSDALALLVSLDLSQGSIDAAADGLDRLEDMPRGPAAFLIGDAAVLRDALQRARESSVPNPEGG